MSVREFAIDAIGALIAITKRIKSPFCNSLTAELFLIRDSIQAKQNEENSKLETKLKSLLQNLERLCRDDRSATANIRRFATSGDVTVREQRKEFLQMLKKFGKQAGPRDSGSLSQHSNQMDPTPTMPEDHHLAVSRLYDALSRYCVCQQDEIDAKVRLRNEGVDHVACHAFNVLVLAHPHQYKVQGACFWQSARIKVLSEDGRSSANMNIAIDPISNGELCNRIGTGRQSQLSLFLLDQTLHLDEWCREEKAWMSNSNSVSLCTLLENHKLNQRGRYLLSFFLSRAVSLYYGSNWMSCPWTKENIHFMFERRGGILGVFLNEPFATFRTSPTDNKEIRKSNSFLEIHALGVMLLEIELGTVIENEMENYPECFGPDGNPVLDADLYTAIKLHDDSGRMEDTHRLLYDVIGHCLRPVIFKPYCTEPTGLRRALYRYIVSPLQELITGSYSEPDPERIPVSRPTLELDLSLMKASAAFSSSPMPVQSPSLMTDITTSPREILADPYRDNGLVETLHSLKLDRQNASQPLNSAEFRYTHTDYSVGWICALPVEMAACTAMLAETHPDLATRPDDGNAYALGSVGSHNVVIACLPSGVYGTTSAATVAMDMLHSFPSIRHRFMVGIGGGIPSKKADIRLGDIVVCKPTESVSGVFQHDMGRTLQGNRTQATGSLNKPPQHLLTAISKLQSQHLLTKSKICSYLDIMQKCLGDRWCNFQPPNPLTDRLHKSSFLHADPNDDTCSKCERGGELTRSTRTSNGPQIHYGPIASGNQVIKDSCIRDTLGEQGFLAFEMEAAGLMDRFPCLVIRGICDYSDSHKNKAWQGYAASTAAAFAKEVLSVIPA